MSQQRATKKFGHAMAALAWLVFLAFSYTFFNDLLLDRQQPNRHLVFVAPNEDQGDIVLRRNPQGHYLAPGAINSHPVTFLIDTGATQVTLSAALADQLALPRGPQLISQTANGNAVSFRTALTSVSVAGLTQREVPAIIAPNLQTKEVLLGMNFLAHIELIQRGDTLTMRMPKTTYKNE
jgi:aspartyl protease family protein